MQIVYRIVYKIVYQICGKNLPESHDDKRFVLLFIGDNYITCFLLNESILLTNTFAKIDYEDYRDFLSVPFFTLLTLFLTQCLMMLLPII
jgi:hypothetical protein